MANKEDFTFEIQPIRIIQMVLYQKKKMFQTWGKAILEISEIDWSESH